LRRGLKDILIFKERKKRKIGGKMRARSGDGEGLQHGYGSAKG